jgi:hypothetical protein
VLFEAAEVDKNLAYLVFRDPKSNVVHTQCEHDVARLSSLKVFNWQFVSAAELVVYVFLFKRLGLLFENNLRTVYSARTCRFINYNRFLKVLDFEQIQLHFDFRVRWTKLECIVQKVDKDLHKTVFIPIDVLVESLLVF